MNETKQEQINCQYTYNQKVIIVYGIYKNKIGTIKKVQEQEEIAKINNKDTTIKTVVYDIEIDIDQRQQRIQLKEEHIEPQKKRKWITK